jgi:capsular exopolysaccharide synthesis family protein
MLQPTDKKSNNLLDISGKFSLREILLKYLSFLPLFVFCMVVSVGIGIVYIRYSVPMYKANALMLIGNELGVVNSNSNDPISNALFGGRVVNTDNELEQLRSRTLLEKVVKRKNLNIYYYNVGKFKTSDIYTGAPFVIEPLLIQDSSASRTFTLTNLDIAGGTIALPGKGNLKFKWNDSITSNGFNFRLRKRFTQVQSSETPYLVTWQPPRYTASEIQGALSIGQYSTKATILSFSINVRNPKRGEDILNALLEEYNKRDVDLKNKISQNTIDFINERLNYVTRELHDVENQIKDFKTQSKFFDPDIEYSYYLGKSNSAEDAVMETNIRLQVLSMIEDYVKNNKNQNLKITTTLGINDDVALNTSIVKYNEIQYQIDKEKELNTEASPILADLRNQLKEARNNILISISNLRNYYNYLIRDKESKNGRYLNEINKLPEKDRQLIDIKRQKDIKEKLFLYLLQRREETEISRASTKSNYMQIDPATSSNTPFEPKTSNIRSFTILLGLVIPIALIYLMELLNDKVITKEDINKKVKLPVAGEISHVDSEQELVIENSRNVVAEQFRILRSNLQFLLPVKEGAKTILITSTISGEGKSFISLNLGAVLSLTNKKVALLEFDLRKLRSLKVNTVDPHTRGITNYLIDQVSSPEEIISKMDAYPNLDIFHTGPIPPNPAELMVSNKMVAFFEWLKANYDYVVLDSAPVGLVSDSFSLAGYADCVLYIVRQRYTFKKQLDFLSDINAEKKMSNMAVVVNDVQLGGRYGYYGYGYGYGYGYMYKYGFGAKYGYNRYGLYGNNGKKGGYFDNKGYFDKKPQPWWKKLIGKN